MVDVVTSWFYIKSHDFDREFLESHSSILFDRWDTRVSQSFRLEDYSLTLVVEEGSVKGFAKVVAPLSLLYVAIAQYGSFITGLETIYSQAEYVTNAVFSEAKGTFELGENQGNTKRKGGAVVYLRKLFDRVEAGDITSEEAMRGVKEHFGDEALAIPGFMEDLESSLKAVPRLPEQLTLEDETWPEYFQETTLKTLGGDGAATRSSSRKPSHYRVEIVRESRRNEKVVTVARVK